jgi:4-amino-4-deoxy-L-arabinose transferase-like glycosyltransferase
MIATGDWMTPRLNGIPHYHKPPFSYWMAGGGMSLFGLNEWGARIGLALAGVFALWGTSVIARRAFSGDNGDAGADAATPGAMALLAPLVLASSLLFFILSRQLASDAFLAAAVVGFWVAHMSPRYRHGVLPLAALGLGFFIKGPVVFLHTLVPALVGAWIARDRAPIRSFAQDRGWLLFAAIGLGWYVVEALRVPGLARYWIQNQLWERYATTVHHRGGPWYYFAAALVAGALPWTAAVVAGAWADAKRAARLSYPRAALFAWLVLPPLFFSTSGSKLATYVLPEMPAVAIFAAYALRRGVAWARVSAAILAAIAIGIEIAGPAAWAKLESAQGVVGSGLPWPLHLAAAVMVAAALALAARRLATGAALTVAAWLLVIGAARTCEVGLGAPRTLVARLRAELEDRDAVIEYRWFHAGLPFYLRRSIPMLEVPRELDFDAPAAERAMLTRDEARTILTAHKRVWVYAPKAATAPLASDLGGRVVPWETWRGREVARIEAIE